MSLERSVMFILRTGSSSLHERLEVCRSGFVIDVELAGAFTSYLLGRVTGGIAQVGREDYLRRALELCRDEGVVLGEGQVRCFLDLAVSVGDVCAYGGSVQLNVWGLRKYCSMIPWVLN
ncbi:hypothetical protein HY640_01680 [Candidatus Woesearchaeota archaeon]|nr:hypothetical protein [Candidatus Woesearchaeota archaeon]